MSSTTPSLLFLIDSPNLAAGHALAGTPARVLALAEHVHRGGADALVVACDRGADYAAAWPVDVLLVHPADFYDPAALARIVDAPVDLVVVCEAQAVLTVGQPLARRLGARIVYDVHDDDAALSRSLGEPLPTTMAAARTQRAAIAVADAVIACATAELALARSAGVPASRAAMVPNGADPARAHCWGPCHHPPRLVFVGNLYYKPNQLGVAHIRNVIVPQLRRRRDDATVTVIGRGPGNLSGESAGLRFTGGVDSLNAALRGTTLALAPLTAGAGSKMKMLTYLAAGLPVLATSEAVSGLPVGHPGVLVDDDLTAWGERIADLLSKPALLDKHGAAGRRLVEGELSWQRITGELVRRCRDWAAMPPQAEPTGGVGEPAAVARWMSEHAAQNALGCPRHTRPGSPHHLGPRSQQGHRQ